MSTTSSPAPTADNRGLLPVGTVLDDGSEIVHVSLTAYLVSKVLPWSPEPHEFWRSFDEVHGRPAPVMPLVVFG